MSLTRTSPNQAAPPATGSRPTWPWWEPWVAVAVLVLIGWRTEIAGGIRIGDVVALAALPVTWVSARSSKMMGTVMLATVLAISTGVALSYAFADTFVIAGSSRRAIVLAVAAVPAGACALAWARERLNSSGRGTERAVIALCCGLLLVAAQRVPSLDNPWKFALGMPVSIMALAWAHRLGRAGQLTVIVVLAGIYLVNDSRSAVGFLAVTAALLVLQATASWLRLRGRPRTLLRVQALAAAAIGVGTVLAVVSASRSGLLGQAAQTRTLLQSEGAENLLVSARPEMGATLSLLGHRLWGYGAGVTPNYSDVRVAMQGMSSLSYDPQNSYVLGYMFSHTGFELHSGLADLWVALSVPGLLLGLFVVGACLIALGRNLATLRSRAWVVLVAVVVVWNLFFGPFNGVVGYMQIALGTAITLPSVALQERVDREGRR